MKSKETKLNLGFLQKNSFFFFLVSLLFFYFHFFSESPNLANIRVDFAHNFEFVNFFCIILETCDLLQKK